MTSKPLDDVPTDVVTSTASPSLELAAIELVVIDGPDAGLRTELLPGRTRIGSAQTSHLRLRDPLVSRVHCELSLLREGVRVTDTCSTNGTWLDDVRVSDVLMTAGGVLRVGQTSIRIQLGHEPLLVPVSSRHSFGQVLGTSAEMRRVYGMLERASRTDATILIRGESGTGKELIAEAIHEASPRAGAPFVPVDCGAIAESLIESELFGHVRGAFTGAIADRKGLFEEAQGGTLFLDEIGELPLAVQPKLLRVIEGREIRRVGRNVQEPVDVRVIAATNRRLDECVNAGTFREDLYYRLAVVEVDLPPLRARREDIPLLAAHFHERFTGKPEGLPAALIPMLMARTWPGNVRELRNFIERSVSLEWAPSSNASIAGEGAGPGPASAENLIDTRAPFKQAREAWMDRFEGIYLRALLRNTSGNVTRAAELAGIDRRTLQRMMNDLGLRPGGRDD